MALNAYLTLVGSIQGKINGSTIQKGREGQIEVIAFNHEIVSATDPASGQVTGKRTHKPLCITKQVDRSSPLLMQALVSNETLTSFELKFWALNKKIATGSAGTESNHYTIRLADCRIVDVKSIMLNNKNPELVHYAEHEEITFVYNKIEWWWMPTGVHTTDSWQ